MSHNNADNMTATWSLLRRRKHDVQRRACLLHGPLVGVRYCPECASMGKPWTEEQADAAFVDGGQSGLAREVSEPANTKEQALRTRLECWLRDGYTDNETPLDAYGQEIVREVLSSLTREREP